MFIRNGQFFDIYKIQFIGENQYPVGWFFDPDQREAFNVVYVDDPVPPATEPGIIVTLNGFEFLDNEWVPLWVYRNLTAEELAQIAAELVTAKIAKELSINAMRDSANSSSFPYAGKFIAVAELDMRDILVTAGYIALFGELHPDWPGGWFCTDKSFIPITTVDDFKGMYSAMYVQGAHNFAHSQALKAALISATTIKQVNAIVW